MKDFKISNKQIDGLVYSQTFNRLQEEADKFDAAVREFKENGLPTSMDFLRSATDMALRKYLDKEAQERITEQGGILCDEEVKQAIINKCRQTYDNVKVAARVVNNAITKPTLPIVKVTNGLPHLDRTKIKELATIAATYYVNAEKLEEYHQLILAVRDAQQAAAKFEKDNGLRHWSDGYTTMDFSSVFGNGYPQANICRLGDYFANFEDSAGNWVQAFGKHFPM